MKLKTCLEVSEEKGSYLKGWFSSFPVWAVVGDGGDKKRKNNFEVHFKVQKKIISR